MTEIELSNRQLEILSAIVANYIKNGEPVSSGTVYAVLKLDVCASTIRSDMSELTAMGLIRKLHTSSGSVPSASGYKLYASKIAAGLYSSMKENPTKVSGGSFLSPVGKSLGDLFSDLLNVLSKVTGGLSFLYFEPSCLSKIINIRLVKITDNSLAIFIVFSCGTIKNKMIRLSFGLEKTDVENLELLLQDEICGKSVKDISVIFLQGLAAHNAKRFVCLTEILGEVTELLNSFLERRFYFSQIPSVMLDFLQGQVKLFSLLEFIKNKRLLNSFAMKNNLGKNDGLTVFVGKENASFGLPDFSIVSSRYGQKEDISGGIGVIGPMRMDYSLVLPNLAYVTSFFNKVFSSSK